MDIDIRSIKNYWESYQHALEGEPWRFIKIENITEKIFPTVSTSSYDIIMMEILNWCLVIGVIIIALFVIFFLDSDTKVEEVDLEASKEPPPSYDDVIKQEQKELNSQKYLPSYIQAVKAENNEYLLNHPELLIPSTVV